MKYAVQATMTFNDAAERDNAVAFVQQHADARTKWGPVTIEAVETGTDQTLPVEQQGPSAIVELRYDGRADMDDLFVKLRQRLESPAVASKLSSWKVYIHECDHDATPPTPCSIEQIASG